MILGGGRRRQNGGLPGMLISGVSTGVGFVGEIRAYKKAKKQALKEQEEHKKQEGAQLDEYSSNSQHASRSRSPRPSADHQQRSMDLRELHDALPEDDLYASTAGAPPPYEESPDEEKGRYYTDKKSTSFDAGSREPSHSPQDDRSRSPGDNFQDLSPAQAAIERSWQLDEAQEAIVEQTKPRKSKQGVANPDKVISAFLQRVQPDGIDPTRPRGQLTLPVAIPQRRPKDKKRGFISAYAAELESVGIDQKSWLDFIETLNEASLANPWINAINLAGLAASPLPMLASQAISIALLVSTSIAIELQSRYRQNHALDRLNKEYFRPRGLYCLVMTWDPTKFNDKTNANISATIQNNMSGQTNRNMSHRFQSSNGITNGVTNGLETMETAELIFPELDLISKAMTGDQKGFKKKLGRGKAFVDDYMDRRAQAKFAAANPGGPLMQQGKPKFSSKYADPTYNSNPFANNNMMGGGLGGGFGRGFGGRGGILAARREMGGGGLIGLVGMAMNRGSQQQNPYNDRYMNNMQYSNSMYYDQRGFGQQQQYFYQQQGYMSQEQEREMLKQMNQQQVTQDYFRRGASLTNLFGSKVLYLMVVNMPTEAEMEEARGITDAWDVQGNVNQYGATCDY